MLEFNVLQWAILISNGYKYFLFLETGDVKDPLIISIKVIPFQKLQDAKAMKSLYGDSVFMLKALRDYELIYDLAQGIPGVKYLIQYAIELPKMKVKKSKDLVK